MLRPRTGRDQEDAEKVLAALRYPAPLASPGFAFHGEPAQRDNPCATQSLLRYGTGPSRPWLGRSAG
jgi:hypothetical protein